MTNKSGKYQLVLSEIYNETIHGLSNHADYDIKTHYLIIEIFAPKVEFQTRVNRLRKNL